MNTIGLLFRVIFSLALTVGIILLIAKLYQKKAGHPSGSRRQRPIDQLIIRNRLSIAKGSSVAVVELGTRSLIIGVTSQRITLLCDLGNDRATNIDAQPRTTIPRAGLGTELFDDRAIGSIDLTSAAVNLSTNSTIADLTSKMRDTSATGRNRRNRLEELLASKLSQVLSGRPA